MTENWGIGTHQRGLGVTYSDPPHPPCPLVKAWQSEGGMKILGIYPPANCQINLKALVTGGLASVLWVC